MKLSKRTRKDQTNIVSRRRRRNPGKPTPMKNMANLKMNLAKLPMPRKQHPWKTPIMSYSYGTILPIASSSAKDLEN